MKIDKIAEIWSNGIQVKLILHVPNNKNIVDIEESPFFNKVVDFKKKVALNSISYFKSLKDEINDYCELESFFTDDGDYALELEIIKC